MLPHHQPDHKNLFLAVFLAALVLIGWQAMVEWPRRQKLAQYQVTKQEKIATQQSAHVESLNVQEQDTTTPMSRAERLAASPRIAIKSDTLDGSISLKGARLDDLRLVKYRVALEKDSPEVILLSPQGDKEAYFVQIGWLAADGKTKVPDQNTFWQADSYSLGNGQTVKLRWNNGEGVTFMLSVALDDKYMFIISQSVDNRSGAAISLTPYAYLNRAYEETSQHYGILHEGPIGVMQNTLEEISYKTLRDKGSLAFDESSGWLGITDKYWLAAFIPGESGYKATFSHYASRGKDRYQVDYLGQAFSVATGEQSAMQLRLFAGAKEIDVLDRYAAGAGSKYSPIPLFDRAVDFGVLYFLTKPLFLTLNFFYQLIGNFGIAIMLLTIVVKLLMYPLANKSYHAMAQLRKLQPEMLKLRERYLDDQIAMQKEMMALYKREKVNPASGCLPLLIQMPVFFALYKVLFVTIEMRHAPFFGWIKDLSVADPSNIFTAFGLLEWSHPAWLHLGILPILMCGTMVFQMKQQPAPADPVQAKMMAYMPYFFLFIFASFPAGLVLYWVWSNTLSILQQHVISSRYQKKNPAPAAKAA